MSKSIVELMSVMNFNITRLNSQIQSKKNEDNIAKNATEYTDASIKFDTGERQVRDIREAQEKVAKIQTILSNTKAQVIKVRDALTNGAADEKKQAISDLRSAANELKQRVNGKELDSKFNFTLRGLNLSIKVDKSAIKTSAQEILGIAWTDPTDPITAGEYADITGIGNANIKANDTLRDVFKARFAAIGGAWNGITNAQASAALESFLQSLLDNNIDTTNLSDADYNNAVISAADTHQAAAALAAAAFTTAKTTLQEDAALKNAVKQFLRVDGKGFESVVVNNMKTMQEQIMLTNITDYDYSTQAAKINFSATADPINDTLKAIDQQLADVTGKVEQMKALLKFAQVDLSNAEKEKLNLEKIPETMNQEVADLQNSVMMLLFQHVLTEVKMQANNKQLIEAIFRG